MEHGEEAGVKRMKRIHMVCEISKYKIFHILTASGILKWKWVDTTCIILIHLYEWLEIHAFVCLYTLSDLYTLGWYMLVFSDQLEGMG